MSPRGWASLALAVALAVAGVWIYSAAMASKVARAEQAASEMKGKVDALQEQAGIAVAQADEAAKTAAQHANTVADLKAKLRALHASATASAPSGATTADPSIGGSATGASDEASLANQIIAAQDKQIAALGVEVTGLRAALDAKDKALVTSEQRARGLEIALEAQRHASRSQRWLGRIEGVAVGLLVGYAGGKIQ